MHIETQQIHAVTLSVSHFCLTSTVVPGLGAQTARFRPFEGQNGAKRVPK